MRAKPNKYRTNTRWCATKATKEPDYGSDMILSFTFVFDCELFFFRLSLEHRRTLIACTKLSYIKTFVLGHISMGTSNDFMQSYIRNKKLVQFTLLSMVYFQRFYCVAADKFSWLPFPETAYKERKIVHLLKLLIPKKKFSTWTLVIAIVHRQKWKYHAFQWIKTDSPYTK